MTASTITHAPSQSRTLQGITCVLAGMVLFVGQDVLMKGMLTHYPVWMLIFSRSVVALITLLPLVLWLGAPHRILTPLWPWYLARAVLFASGFAMFYTAFPFMGLAEVTTLFFAAPLMTATLAALFLQEKVGMHRIAALLVGFAGVVIAMNPTGGNFGWISVLPLFCALTYAISQIIVRKIGEQDTSLVIGLYTISFSGFVIIPMGFVVTQMIAAMKKKSIEIKGSKILIMGLTFKENCPDIRNSGVQNVIKKLAKHDCKLDLYDPWADKKEIRKTYNMYPKTKLSKNIYDGILITVAHKKFKNMGIKKILELCKKNRIIYDLKHLFVKDQVDLRL